MSAGAGTAGAPADLARGVPAAGDGRFDVASADGAPGVVEPGRGRRGLAWVVGSFVLCPCHLPLTLTLLGTVAGGTAFGALLHRQIVLAGVVITTVWVFGMWRGLRLLRQPAACPVPGAGRGAGKAVREFFGLPAGRTRPARR